MPILFREIFCSMNLQNYFTNEKFNFMTHPRFALGVLNPGKT